MQNLLLTSEGVLKIADFGMARKYDPDRPLTAGVSTIWYRSPELLLGTCYYTPSVDIWSAGIILAELLLSDPVLPGEHELEQLSLIVKFLGSPDENDMDSLEEMGCPQLLSWAQVSRDDNRETRNLEQKFLRSTTVGTVDFLTGLLTWDPRARWTAREALGKAANGFGERADRWWRESPREVDRAQLPIFPDRRDRTSEGGLSDQGDEVGAKMRRRSER
ncbi:MAG: hypothetical protein M1837_000125 [Sclerophora amabilis]|nr:MAG: hypothetical protein M1837_000125 [Sclerophora amabilis]